MSPWQPESVKHQWSEARLKEVEWNSLDLRKAIGIFFEKAVSWMKRRDRPLALMEFIAIKFDLALNWEKAHSCELQKFEVVFESFSDFVCVCYSSSKNSYVSI